MRTTHTAGALRPWFFGLWLLLALAWSLEVSAAGFTARVDRTRVAEGETLTLELVAPGDSDGTPDLAPLARDFDLLDQGQSTRMSIVNGHSSRTREWRLVLAPKRTGRLRIPALSLGAARSNPVDLEVLPATEAARLGQARPVLLEVEATPETPYVQGRVDYRVRVLSRVSLREAGLSEPRAEGAIVERLGKDRQYSAERDGQRYQVIERRYALFPQHSGKLEIEPPVLSAQVPEQGRGNSLRDRMFGGDPFAGMGSLFGRDPFGDMGGLFARTRPVQVRGKAVSLEVRPQPAGSPSPWLPAESLSLSESWSPDPPVLRVGEPVTRTLAITAQGLTAAQLPDLQPALPAALKAYPDKPQAETRPQGDTLVSQKVLKTALVPSQAGELTLPAVKLAWWDTRTGTPRVATLPARSFQVLPAVAGAPAPRVEPGATARAAPAAPVSPPAAAPEPAASPLAGNDGAAQLGDTLMRAARLPAGYWPWISAALGLAWLVSLGLWLRERSHRQAPPAAGPVTAPASDPAKALGRLAQACRASDAGAARQALLDWGEARWPEQPPRRLEGLGQRLGGDAEAVLRELDRALYAAAQGGWDGPAAWRRLGPVLTQARPQTGARGRDAPLPPLYPQAA